MNSIFRNAALAFTLIGSALAFGACAGTPTSESTGAYVDNTVITTKVKTAFLQDPALKVFQIKVITYKNVVQLSGFVDTSQIKSHASAVASQVAGVASVTNDLVVK